MIYTFGYGHSVDGVPLKRAFYRIPLPFVEARERMFAMFGDAWGFEYETEDEAGVSKYGLIELIFRHPAIEFIGPKRQTDPLDTCMCGGVRKDHEMDSARKKTPNPNRVLKNHELSPCTHCPCPEFIVYDAPVTTTIGRG